MARILLVDDDATLRMVLTKELKSRGFEVSSASSAREGLERLRTEEPEVAIINLRLPDGDGLDIVRRAKQDCPATELVVLTGHGTIDTAIEAMRCGAFDYLRKPCPTEELEVTLQKALEHRDLIRRNTILSEGYAPPDMGAEFVGDSPAFFDLCALINRVAVTDSTVLLLGETGVGKDVVAKLLHARSSRGRKPLVVVECAALHEQLLHNELFGHEKGAFTSATEAKHGLFEVADGGTIFLDEVGDVSATTQVKLLRVLETGCFRRVGGTKEIQVDVRILAATNRDLNGMMERGYFRKDLFYRLSTIRIEVPPLRERVEDLPTLIDHFLRRCNARFGQNKEIGAEAMQKLESYNWPGNVRELLNVIEQAVLLSEGDVITPQDLPRELSDRSPTEVSLVSLRELERQHIERVLSSTAGNRNQAARILEISERTLYRKLREYGLPDA